MGLVEITDPTGDQHAIVTDQIVLVHKDRDTGRANIIDWTHHIYIVFKNGSNHKIQFLKHEKECQAAYDAIKRSLAMLYHKDEVAEEVKKYLSGLVGK